MAIDHKAHQQYLDHLAGAVRLIQTAVDFVPKVAIVLGSGLGPMAERIAKAAVIPYSDIEGCPLSTVPGHEGKLILGHLAGVPVVAMQGRFHYYEGHPMQDVVFMIRVFALAGIKSLVLTNAAGGVNKGFEPGDLMVITDHIGLFCNSPLNGPNFDELGPRFNDQTHVYDKDYRELAHRCADELGITLRDGVYCYTQGPAFETPAEIRAIGLLGGDAVGMSTVPEAICANHAGMRIYGMSCITNLAAGISPRPLSHEEVLETGARVSAQAVALVEKMLPEL